MYLNPRKGQNKFSVISYSQPKLHEGKYWYVDFVAYDPVEDKMKRKKYMLNHIANVRERRQYANELITNLNIKLRSGWSPWYEVKTTRQLVRYIDVINMYHIYLTKLHKSGTIKHNTLLDYTKRVRVLEEYNTKHHYSPIVYAYQFDQQYVSEFLDYILIDRDSSARTRNNYRTWLSSLSNWMIERNYITVNPVEKIKMLAESEKLRDAISVEHLDVLSKYLKEQNKYFLFLCQFAYYTFIRPEEITNIKLSDIHLHEQKVFIPSSVSKNRRDGMVGLNDSLIRTMVDLNVFESPNNCYLFSREFKPGMTKLSTKVFRSYFNKVRDALKFPKSYQFYSLKDSGIRDLANSEGIVIARDQARHSDISTTNRYLKGGAVHEEAKHFKGNI